MRLPAARHQLLSESVAALALGVLLLLVSILGSRASAEGTLPGAFAFPARAGAESRRAKGPRTATSMAETGAKAEWANVRA